MLIENTKCSNDVWDQVATECIERLWAVELSITAIRHFIPSKFLDVYLDNADLPSYFELDV